MRRSSMHITKESMQSWNMSFLNVCNVASALQVSSTTSRRLNRPNCILNNIHNIFKFPTELMQLGFKTKLRKDLSIRNIIKHLVSSRGWDINCYCDLAESSIIDHTFQIISFFTKSYTTPYDDLLVLIFTLFKKLPMYSYADLCSACKSW